jgi:hypothetical protein
MRTIDTTKSGRSLLTARNVDNLTSDERTALIEASRKARPDARQRRQLAELKRVRLRKAIEVVR